MGASSDASIAYGGYGSGSAVSIFPVCSRRMPKPWSWRAKKIMGNMKRIHWLISDFYFWLYIRTGNRNVRWFQKFINHERKARLA